MTDPVPSPSQPHLRTADLRRNAEQVTALLQAALQSLENPHQPHLLTVTDDGEIEVKAYSNIAALVARLRELHGTDTYGVPFVGYPLEITPGSQHFLVLEDGERVPLFDPDEGEEAAPSWHLGASPNPPAADPPPATDVGDFDEYDVNPDDDDDDEDDEADWDPEAGVVIEGTAEAHVDDGGDGELEDEDEADEDEADEDEDDIPQPPE